MTPTILFISRKESQNPYKIKLCWSVCNTMSYQCSNSPEGVWFESDLNMNLNANDASIQSTSTLAGMPESAQSDVYRSSYEKVQLRRYMCGACGENVLEDDLAEHHSTLHSETPFFIDMYELFEIDEQIHCLICDVKFFDHELTKHIQEFHIEKYFDWSNSNYVPNPIIDEVTWPQTEHEIPQKIQAVKVGGNFKCRICRASNIQVANLMSHRSELHAAIPMKVNIFVRQPEREKYKCEVCGKLCATEKSFLKHRHKYHPDKYGDDATKSQNERISKVEDELTTGFRNIRISHEEFERFLNRNRIYEANGHHYLKDSEVDDG